MTRLPAQLPEPDLTGGPIRSQIGKPQKSQPLIHFAGLDVQIGPLLRQRCAWCGHTLVDYDLNRVAVPTVDVGTFRPATWPVGSLVRVDGSSPRVSTLVLHEDGQQLPEGTCVDAPEATR